MSQNRDRRSPGATERQSTSGRNVLPLSYYDPVPIYVPTKPWIGRPFGVLPGSAIVGVPSPNDVPDTIVVYFEGNLYGDDYFARFATRCLHAHGRMTQQYPTVAKARILLRNLSQVGIWHPQEKVVEVADLASLAEWCNWSLPVSAEELRAE